MGKKVIGVKQRGEESYRIHYTDRSGVRHFETVNGTLDDALDIRKVRLGDIARGIPVSSKPNTLLFEELALDLLTEYKLNGYSTYSDQETRLRLHILPAFGKRKAAQISSAVLKSYSVMRRDEGAAVATVNRELELMRHAFYLGQEATPPKVLFMPKFPIAQERNVRKGFFEREQLNAILRHLPTHLAPIAMFGYLTGWRHGEVVTLCWRHVHFQAGEIRLEAAETKNRHPRTFPMIDELRDLLERVKPDKFFPGDRVFVREVIDRATEKTVKAPIVRFDKAWTTACRAAGLPLRLAQKQVMVDGEDPAKGKTAVLYKRGKRKGQPVMVARASVYFHDFRRTAYRNLVRMGIPEKIAMEAVGWKDRKTADRYNITAAADLDLIRYAFDGPRANIRAISRKTGFESA